MKIHYKRKSHRKNKFYKVAFKLTFNQYNSLLNYCRARKTTPVKLIKRSIERFTSCYTYEVPDELYLSENSWNCLMKMKSRIFEIICCRKANDSLSTFLMLSHRHIPKRRLQRCLWQLQ